MLAFLDKPKLFSQSQFFYDSAVAFDVLAFEVFEQAATFTYHHHQGTFRTEVVNVLFQVIPSGG